MKDTAKGILKIRFEKELVEEILIYLQFLGLHDKKIFTKKDLSKEPVQTGTSLQKPVRKIWRAVPRRPLNQI